jgi:hypothetical protein
MPISFQNSTDPKKVAANNRGLIQQQGDVLQQENTDLANKAEGQVSGYQGFLDPIEQQMASGNGGFSPEEAAAIQGNTGPHGLDSLPASQEQLNSNFLTPNEQAAIKGNTGSYTDYFNPNQMQDTLTRSQGTQNEAVQGLQNNLNNAIDPNALKQSSDYTSTTGDQLQQNQGNFKSALGSEASKVRGAIDPNALKQDAGAAQTEVMTPEQQQEMVTAAGISAGTQNQAAVGSLQRAAAAAGTNPMGVAAYRARMNQNSAVAAGDAMTNARVQAQQARAGEALSSEQQRLAAEGKLTDVQTGTELNLGQQNVSGQQTLGAQALNQANTQEQNRQAAQQFLTGAQMQSATTGGEAALQNAQTMTGQEQQQQQFAANTGTNIRQSQDQADSGRAATVAGNRQQTGEANQGTAFTQGNTVNQEGSQRATTIAQQRQNQQNVGLGLQSGQEQMQNSNAQGAYGRQQQGYATQTNGVNQAAGVTQAASQNPTTLDKVMGGIAGGISGAASFLDEGGIATKPTLAVIGENGPEKVVPLSGYRARMPQQQAAPLARKPRRYGQEAA